MDDFSLGRYEADRSDAARRVEQQALGHAEGVNGYTTVAQARRLAQTLELAPGVRLLDIGAGRGWPGTFLAAETGCDVVLTDLPLTALGHARRYARRRGVLGRTGTVCADASALPFVPGVFDRVVHADVFC